MKKALVIVGSIAAGILVVLVCTIAWEIPVLICSPAALGTVAFCLSFGLAWEAKDEIPTSENKIASWFCWAAIVLFLVAMFTFGFSSVD